MSFKTSLMFDLYTYKARIFPVIILIFPGLLIGALYSFSIKSFVPFGASAIIFATLSNLLSHIGRTFGKKKEKKLWESWGGAPSITMLRWADSNINVHTKSRYHIRLQELAPVATPPDRAMENNNPADADLVYESWNAYLLSQTRDKEKYSLLHNENASYGFRRNLWGLKQIAVPLLFLLGIINYIINAVKLNSWRLDATPMNFCIGTVIIAVFIIFWLTVVTKFWVKSSAYSYAKQLIEATGSL